MYSTITGIIKNVDGVPLRNILVRLSLQKTGYENQDVYIKDAVKEVYSSTDGTFSATVWNNTGNSTGARYLVEYIDSGETIDQFYANIPLQASVTMAEVITYSALNSGTSAAGYGEALQVIDQKLSAVNNLFTNNDIVKFGTNDLPTPTGATGAGAKADIDKAKLAVRFEIKEVNNTPSDDQLNYMRGRIPTDAANIGPMTVGFGRANMLPAIYALANGHNNSAYGVASFSGGAGSATGNPDDPTNTSGNGRGYCSIAYGKNVLAYGAKGAAFGEGTLMYARAGTVSGYYSQAGDENGQDIGNVALGYKARTTGTFAGAGGSAIGNFIWARNGSTVRGTGLNESNPYASRADVNAADVTVLRGKPIISGVLQADYTTVWNGYGNDKPTQRHDLSISDGEAVAVTLNTTGAVNKKGMVKLQGLDNVGGVIELGRIEFTHENGGSGVSEIRIFTSYGGLRNTPDVTIKSDGSVKVGKIESTSGYFVGDTKVVGGRSAAIPNSDGTLASVNSTLNTLLAAIRTHGLINP